MISNHQFMGILNITPNSFSDGGQFNHINSLSAQIEKWNGLSTILDVGAESTAPFNDPISAQEECDRFSQILFPIIKQGLWPEDVRLSVDTYRTDSFLFVYNEVKKVNPDISLIWNDVSGVVDDDLFTILLHDCPDATYVHSHTLVPSRDKTSDHMNYLSQNNDDQFLSEVISHFDGVHSLFIEKGVMDRVIFDPCFGFSKTRGQNQYLIRELDELVSHFPSDVRWLLGVSRKSFLRYLPKDDQRIISQTEYLHAMLLSHWAVNAFNRHYIYRIHDPLLAQMQQKYCLDFAKCKKK